MAKKHSIHSVDSFSRTGTIANVFDRFGARDYVLCPHTNPAGRWIFTHLWIILLGLLLAIVLLVVINISRAPDAEAMRTRLVNEVTHPLYAFIRCPGYDTGIREDVYFIFPLEVEVDCDANPLPPEIAVIPRLGPKEEAVVNLVWNSMADAVPLLTGMLLATFLFHHLTRKAPRVFLELAQAGRLKMPEGSVRSRAGTERSSSGDADTGKNLWDRITAAFTIQPRGSSTYAEDFETAIRKPGADFLFVLWLAFASIMAYSFAKSVGAFDAHDGWQGALHFLILGIAPILLAYMANYGIWTLMVITTFIRKLTPSFDLDIQPAHGDQCGGLKGLGDLCLVMAWILLIPATLIALYFLLGGYSASIPEFQFMLVFSAALAILLAGLIFFWPLLEIHNTMEKAKKQFQDAAAARIGPLEQDLRELLGARNYNPARVKSLESRLEKLYKLHPADLKYPTWPFTANVVILFYTGQVLPIVSGVTSLLDLIKLFKQPD